LHRPDLVAQRLAGDRGYAMAAERLDLEFLFATPDANTR
jgi:hypothetical protein